MFLLNNWIEVQFSSSHNVLQDWFATPQENNRTNNRTIPQTFKVPITLTQF